MISVMTLVLAFLQATFVPAKLQQSAAFGHPPNIVGNVWVIADLRIGADGAVRSVQVLEGASPFKEVVLSSLWHWRFTPAHTDTAVPSRAGAIFLFRAPEIFPSRPMERQHLADGSEDRPPLPLTLIDPGYPANSVGAGATVLELQLSRTAAIEAIRVVSDQPGLAEATERAIRSWTFDHAVRDGAAARGTIIVAVSYMRPSLTPSPRK